MKKIVLVVVALASFALLLAGCGGGGGGSKNPFKGTWLIVEAGLNVTFTDKNFSITVPDFGPGNGQYSYEGDYPDFVATLTVEGDSAPANVHFNSEDQFRACGAAGEGCATFNKL